MTDLHALAQKYNLSLLLLFGSRSRGDFRPDSDADVAYLADTTITLLDEARISVELMPLLGAKVDIINIKKSSPLLLRSVFKDACVLFEKEKGLFADSFARVFRQYEECAPLYRAKLSAL